MTFDLFTGMVGKYQRKTNRQSWTEADMQEAINAVQQRKMGWLKASKNYNVPQATLRRRFQNQNVRIMGTKKGLGRYGPTFSNELEREMVDHIKRLETCMFGLTTSEVRALAFQFAEKNHIQHRFNTDRKRAGWDWLIGFRARNPDISLRSPEATSAARAQGFNKPQVQKFFDLLERTLTEQDISFDRIFNVDESALSTVQRPQKILATKGRKQIGAITSAERGIHTTVVCCMNPIGIFIPPALIFARKNWKSELIDDAPAGTLGLCQESGWMTGELFSKWLEHFIKFSKSSKENKTLLLLDGHSSHKNLDALLLAKLNGVIVLCIPPHCTHRLQPLDVSFFGPLSTFYNQAITAWLKNNPGRTVTAYQVAKLFREAYERSATMENAVSGFKQTGIHPFNANIFPEWMFAAAATTDVPVSNEAENVLLQQEPPTTPPQNDTPEAEETANGDDLNISRVSVEDIVPVPKASISSKRRTTRKRQGTTVLNSTPNLHDLKTKAEEKRMKLERSAKRKAVTKNLWTGENEQEEVEEVVEDEEDATCIYCNGLYSQTKPGDMWLRCQACEKWAHADCADVSPRKKQYICELCGDI